MTPLRCFAVLVAVHLHICHARESSSQSCHSAACLTWTYDPCGGSVSFGVTTLDGYQLWSTDHLATAALSAPGGEQNICSTVQPSAIGELSDMLDTYFSSSGQDSMLSLLPLLEVASPDVWFPLTWVSAG